jgi:hypothetical protein
VNFGITRDPTSALLVAPGDPRVDQVRTATSAAFWFNERVLMRAYLDAIGKRLDAFHAPPEDQSPPVAAYLYDLADPGKLSHANANSFPIRGEYIPARWSCYGVATPIASRAGAAAKAVMSLKP